MHLVGSCFDFKSQAVALRHLFDGRIENITNHGISRREITLVDAGVLGETLAHGNATGIGLAASKATDKRSEFMLQGHKPALWAIEFNFPFRLFLHLQTRI